MFKLASVSSIVLLALSALMVLWSNTLWQAWIFMEINLLFFIYWSFFNVKLTLKSLNLSMVYFVVQSSSSLGLFWVIILNNGFSGYLSFMGCLLLLLKLGLFPFHYWLIYMSESTSRLFFLVLMVLQKVIPLALLRFTGVSVALMGLNLFISVIFSFSEVGVLKILVYSSIFNMVWLLMVYSDSWTAISPFYLTYSMTFAILLYYLPLEVEEGSIYWLEHSGFLTKVLLMVGFLSLAGFPGTVGFYFKLMISVTILIFSPLMFYSLLVFSVLIIYLYLRIFFPQLMSSSLKMIDFSGLMVFNPVLSSLILFTPLTCFLVFLHESKSFDLLFSY